MSFFNAPEVPKHKKALTVLLRSAAGLLLAGITAFIIYGAVCAITAVKDAVAEHENESSVLDNAEEYDPSEGGTKIKFSDSILGDVWIPVLEGVEKSNIEIKNIRENDKGMKYYGGVGQMYTCAGIDVSYYQGDIDWEKVRAAGIEFVIIRVGYRGYEGGIIQADSRFEEYIDGATAAGLDAGVYFFSQAVNEAEAVEEAEFVLDMISGKKITYPVVYDWENIGTDPARTDEVSAEMLNACAKSFCDRIRDAGYTPMIYSNKRQAYLKYDLRELSDYDFWLAEFNEFAEYYYKFDIWQYTYEATVDGIETNVDLNICFKDYTGETDDVTEDGSDAATDESTVSETTENNVQ